MRRRRKAKQWKKNAVGIFIVAIMVLSGMGYLWGSQEGEGRQDYNGAQFTGKNGLWYTQVGGTYQGFSYHPSELDAINITASGALRDAKMYYLTFDPGRLVSDFEEARVRMETVLSGAGRYIVVGTTDNTGDYSRFPIITCENATAYVPVIYFAESDTSGINESGNCFVANSVDRYDVSLFTERLLYAVLGII